jgi:hypothetical protein
LNDLSEQEKQMTQEHGVIVGTSKNQEWLLPWWWMHYSLHNTFPVTFVDFGDMSAPTAKWCRERGQLIKLELSDSFMTLKEKIDPALAIQWESFQPNVWSLRSTWYKKPFAMLLSPYQQTIWLDLDCQVRGSLRPMFDYCNNKGGFAAAIEHEVSQEINLQRNIIQPGQLMYNTGVIVLKKGSTLLKEWTERTRDNNHLHCSEQQLMAFILNSGKWAFNTLPSRYNWTIDLKMNKDAVILHYWGDEGKQIIKKFLEGMTNVLHMNLTFDDLNSSEL